MTAVMSYTTAFFLLTILQRFARHCEALQKPKQSPAIKQLPQLQLPLRKDFYSPRNTAVLYRHGRCSLASDCHARASLAMTAVMSYATGFFLLTILERFARHCEALQKPKQSPAIKQLPQLQFPTQGFLFTTQHRSALQVESLLTCGRLPRSCLARNDYTNNCCNSPILNSCV